MLLVDIERAYPSVPPEPADRVFKKPGVPPHMRRLLWGLHRFAKYKLRGSGGGHSQEFEFERGFREGDPSSTVCFNFYHCDSMHCVRGRVLEAIPAAGVVATRDDRRFLGNRYRPRDDHSERIVTEREFKLLDLLFAHDMTFLCRGRCIETLEEVMIRALQDWGSAAHRGKLERIRFGRARPPVRRRTTKKSKAEAELECQESVRFLGCWLQPNGRHTEDIEKRVAAAGRVWHRLRPQLRRLSAPKKMLGQVIRSVVHGAALYGLETRYVPPQDMQQLQAFQSNVVFGALSIRRRDMSGSRRTLGDLRKHLVLMTISGEGGVWQLPWAVHVARLQEDALKCKMLYGELACELRCGVAKGGGIHGHWRTQMWDRIQEMMELCQSPDHSTKRYRHPQAPHWRWHEEWHGLAQDRGFWRKSIKPWRKKALQLDADDCWDVRHKEGGIYEVRRRHDEARRRAAAEVAVDVDGLKECRHCKDVMPAATLSRPLKQCAPMTWGQRRRLATSRRKRLAVKGIYIETRLSDELRNAEGLERFAIFGAREVVEGAGPEEQAAPRHGRRGRCGAEGDDEAAPRPKRRPRAPPPLLWRQGAERKFLALSCLPAPPGVGGGVAPLVASDNWRNIVADVRKCRTRMLECTLVTGACPHCGTRSTTATDGRRTLEHVRTGIAEQGCL